MTTPIPSTTQDVAVQALTAALDVDVSTRMPDSRPDAHVIVTRIGGGQSSLATNDPRFLIECYATDELEAEALAERAQHAWTHFRGNGIVCGRSDNNLAPYPSPDVNHFRFQFTGSLKLRL